jgi:hypothetical protein
MFFAEHRIIGVLIRPTGTKNRELNTQVTLLIGGLLVRVEPEEALRMGPYTEIAPDCNR